MEISDYPKFKNDLTYETEDIADDILNVNETEAPSTSANVLVVSKEFKDFIGV